MNATRRYVAVTFLTWLPVGLYIAPMVLLMLERGLSVPTIATISLVYSLTVGVLELPTGGLSDVLGRRGVLIASALCSLAGLLCMGLATTAALFTAAAFLRGVARALSSGPAEAWFVDTVSHADSFGPGRRERRSRGPQSTADPKRSRGPQPAADPEGTEARRTPPWGQGLAHGQVALSSGLAIGTIAGGLIPLALTGIVPTPLAVPVLIGAAVEGIRLVVVVFAMPEPQHSRPSFKTVILGVPATVRDGLRLSTRDGMLARLMVISGVIGIMLGTIELLTPAWLAEITGRFETAGIAYAVVAALGFAASALGGSLSTRIQARVGGPVRGAQVGTGIMTVALLALTGSTVLSGLSGVVAAGVSYCLLFVGLGIGNPARSTLTHERVSSAMRATVLSAQSLALMLPGAVGVIALSGLVVITGPAAAFLIVAGLVAATAALLRPPTSPAVPSAAAPPPLAVDHELTSMFNGVSRHQPHDQPGVSPDRAPRPASGQADPATPRK
ncbi:MFS transporter [Allorhizocola rhizosphaerae]|uniref:MFS transporter n=1 Tax=Allorhizocola rhizosphaerae TaxID=1872709 RepID=UPI000E3D6B08|nr:MFS transporter [Allorhizocola rhizosphaerae]